MISFLPEENKCLMMKMLKIHCQNLFETRFYNYILATKDATGFIDLGEINGNFGKPKIYIRHFYITLHLIEIMTV